MAVSSRMVNRSAITPQPASVDHEDLSDLHEPTEILRQQRKAVDRLAASCLANLERVKNNLGVESSTISCGRASLTQDRSENVPLKAEISQLPSELTRTHTLLEEANSYRQSLADSTAKAEHLRGLLTSLLDSVTDALSHCSAQI